MTDPLSSIRFNLTTQDIDYDGFSGKDLDSFLKGL